MPSTPTSSSDSRPSILIFEPDAAGHPLEWLRHLIHYALDDPRGYKLHLVVARGLYVDLARELAGTEGGRVDILPLRPSERDRCAHRSLTVSGFARWHTMRRYLRKTGANAGFFLGIDHVSLPLALGFGFGEPRVSGVLFRPSTHYAAIGPYEPARKEKLRDLRKAILYRLMLLNPALDRVLTLDPYFPDFAASRYANGDKLRAVCDPIGESGQEAPAEIPVQPPSPGRVSFLLFGYLAARKGVLTLIDALRLVSPQIASRISITLAGAVDPQIAGPLETAIASLRTAQPGLELHLDDRRLSDGELARAVGAADVILAPYFRFVGSSGVLLWAARAGKPVITQDFGLLGRLLRDHKLGLAVDTADPAALARAIEQAAIVDPRRLIDTESASAFLAGRAPERFAADVIQAALEATKSLIYKGYKVTEGPSLITRPDPLARTK